MSRSNIVLTGFMGSGKSTIGRELAKRLDRFFIDTDTLIEMNEGMSIPEIFISKGEDYFREIEKNIAPKLARSLRECVISTGGGYVVSADPRKFGIVFYLRCDFETIKARVRVHNHPRPLFKSEEEAFKLYSLRLPMYEKYADFIIDSNENTVENILSHL